MSTNNKIKKFFKLDEYSDDKIKKEIEMEKIIDSILLDLMYINDVYNLYKNNNLEYV